MENTLQKSPTGKLQWERNVNILKQVCLKFKFFFSCSQGNHNSFDVIALELLLAKIFHGGGGGGKGLDLRNKMKLQDAK